MSEPIPKGERVLSCLLKVVEIFQSIDGEGIRAGYPVTFIRLYGCNLHCAYCDSQYACTGESYRELTIGDIITIVESFSSRRITVTGGEPLIHENADHLIKTLAQRGFEVNVETNGTILPTVRYENRIFYTMDYKTGSSGMTAFMNKEAIQSLGSKDVLKFVVGSSDDLKQAHWILKTWQPRAQVFFSPVFGAIEPKEIVEYLIEQELDQCRVQLQLHKYIWSPDKRGV